MTITFEKLQEISKYIQTNNDKKLCEYLNSFDGSNVIEKFKTFLSAWEYHVRYDIEFNLDKPIKIPISTILNSLPEYTEEWIAAEDYNILLGVPRVFYTGDLDLLQNIKVIKVDGNEYVGNFSNYGQVLPAKIYNILLNHIISSNKYKMNYSSDLLKSAEISFIGSQPTAFLKGMLAGFSKEYFQDIIFSLSKRIGGDILMKSDIKDIEYYIQKFNDEVQSGDPSVALM